MPLWFLLKNIISKLQSPLIRVPLSQTVFKINHSIQPISWLLFFYSWKCSLLSLLFDPGIFMKWEIKAAMQFWCLKKTLSNEVLTKPWLQGPSLALNYLWLWNVCTFLVDVLRVYVWGPHTSPDKSSTMKPEDAGCPLPLGVLKLEAYGFAQLFTDNEYVKNK